jgi:hypothetical protein
MRFPDDYHIPDLHAVRVPSATAIRRTFAKRVVWIEEKMRERLAAGHPVGFMVDELAAIAVAMHADPEWPARLAREREHRAETAALINEDAEVAS